MIPSGGAMNRLDYITLAELETIFFDKEVRMEFWRNEGCPLEDEKWMKRARDSWRAFDESEELRSRTKRMFDRLGRYYQVDRKLYHETRFFTFSRGLAFLIKAALMLEHDNAVSGRPPANTNRRKVPTRLVALRIPVDLLDNDKGVTEQVVAALKEVKGNKKGLGRLPTRK
jgi:hypothetical protein